MKIEIILSGFKDHINFKIDPHNRSTKEMKNLINSIFENFRIFFSKVQQMELSNTYIFFHVSFIRNHFTNYNIFGWKKTNSRI